MSEASYPQTDPDFQGEEPLLEPLGIKRPLGIQFLQPKFLAPLGMKPLGVSNPSKTLFNDFEDAIADDGFQDEPTWNQETLESPPENSSFGDVNPVQKASKAVSKAELLSERPLVKPPVMQPDVASQMDISEASDGDQPDRLEREIDGETTTQSCPLTEAFDSSLSVGEEDNVTLFSQTEVNESNAIVASTPTPIQPSLESSVQNRLNEFIPENALEPASDSSIDHLSSSSQKSDSIASHAPEIIPIQHSFVEPAETASSTTELHRLEQDLPELVSIPHISETSVENSLKPESIKTIAISETSIESSATSLRDSDHTVDNPASDGLSPERFSQNINHAGLEPRVTDSSDVEDPEVVGEEFTNQTIAPELSLASENASIEQATVLSEVSTDSLNAEFSPSISSDVTNQSGQPQIAQAKSSESPITRDGNFVTDLNDAIASDPQDAEVKDTSEMIQTALQRTDSRVSQNSIEEDKIVSSENQELFQAQSDTIASLSDLKSEASPLLPPVVEQPSADTELNPSNSHSSAEVRSKSLDELLEVSDTNLKAETNLIESESFQEPFTHSDSNQSNSAQVANPPSNEIDSDSSSQEAITSTQTAPTKVSALQLQQDNEVDFDSPTQEAIASTSIAPATVSAVQLQQDSEAVAIQADNSLPESAAPEQGIATQFFEPREVAQSASEESVETVLPSPVAPIDASVPEAINSNSTPETGTAQADFANRTVAQLLADGTMPQIPMVLKDLGHQHTSILTPSLMAYTVFDAEEQGIDSFEDGHTPTTHISGAAYPTIQAKSASSIVEATSPDMIVPPMSSSPTVGYSRWERPEQENKQSFDSTSTADVPETWSSIAELLGNHSFPDEAIAENDDNLNDIDDTSSEAFDAETSFSEFSYFQSAGKSLPSFSNSPSQMPVVQRQVAEPSTDEDMQYSVRVPSVEPAQFSIDYGDRVADTSVQAKYVPETSSKNDFKMGGEGTVPGEILYADNRLTEVVERTAEKVFDRELNDEPGSRKADSNLNANAVNLETLAREIYYLIRDRFEVERERRSSMPYSGRLPW